MNLLVTYDVSTTTAEGRRRLRAVAKVCEGFGQRVQYSVFEVECSRTDFVRMLARLNDVIDPTEDSLRVYQVQSNQLASVLHVGRQTAIPGGASWTL